MIADNDLFTHLTKIFSRISALSTKSYKVDYITSVREGKAVLNASVDATPMEEGDKDAAAQSQNIISSNDTFDFWKTISNRAYFCVKHWCGNI